MIAWSDPHQPGYRFEESPRRIRTVLGGTVIADSQRMRLLHPPGGRPAAYYFPEDDVRTDLFSPSDYTAALPGLGDASYWDVALGGKSYARVARAYRQPPAELNDLARFVTFDWNAMDAWFEEDEEIFVHPRDPYHRVDTRESSRHIRVEIDGQTVAESRRPCVLFETNHPTRFYLPLLDVRLDLLRPTETRTGCAYKGFASYWSLQTDSLPGRDIAWSYAFPFAECAKIANYICFYNERVDLYVDDVLQERPLERAPRAM
jgi:uncharacterized protein (DUF427 family)